MSKTILITGAGSGFGHGVALGLAKAGHSIIATVETWPQVTRLSSSRVSQFNIGMRYRSSSRFLPEGSTVRPVSRWYSSTASATTTGRPCFSTTTG